MTAIFFQREHSLTFSLTNTRAHTFYLHDRLSLKCFDDREGTKSLKNVSTLRLNFSFQACWKCNNFSLARHVRLLVGRLSVCDNLEGYILCKILWPGGVGKKWCRGKK